MRRYSILIIASLACLLLLSCGNGRGFSFPWTKKPIVGLSFSDFAVERWVRAEEEIRRLLTEAGCEVITEVANHDVALQREQILKLAQRGAKVIIILAEDGFAAAGVVDEVSEKGVKVIAFERPIYSTEVDALVTADWVEIGREQARGILELRPSGKFVLLGGSPTDLIAFRLRAGQMEVITPLIDSGVVEIIADQWVEQWDESFARSAMENIIVATGGGFDAVVASNDGTAVAAISAMRQAGLAGRIPISGMDATQDGCALVLNSELSFTIFKDASLYNTRAADIALKLAHGKRVEGLVSVPLADLRLDDEVEGSLPCAFIPVKRVDRDTLLDLFDEPGFFSREDLEETALILVNGIDESLHEVGEEGEEGYYSDGYEGDGAFEDKSIEGEYDVGPDGYDGGDEGEIDEGPDGSDEETPEAFG